MSPVVHDAAAMPEEMHALRPMPRRLYGYLALVYFFSPLLRLIDPESRALVMLVFFIKPALVAVAVGMFVVRAVRQFLDVRRARRAAGWHH